MGHITKTKRHSCLQLKYAKKEAAKILPHMYEEASEVYLSRKKLKIDQILAIVAGRTKKNV